MNMDDFKSDRQFHKKGILFKQLYKTHNLQDLWQARKHTRKIMKPGTMMKIAKQYADLFCDEVYRSSPYPRFTSSVVIQCPACTIPRDQTCHSAFLELLLHVRNRHKDCSDSLFFKIAWTYASLLESLKRKIIGKLRKRRSERLMNEQRPKLSL